MSRCATRLVSLTAALALLPATTALAHPSFDPNRVPGGQSIEATLVVPHGCGADGGMPGEDGGNATTLFELQLSDAVAEFVPGEVDGWDVSRDGDVVTWADAGGATTDPIQLPVTFTVTGETDEEVFLSAYQRCAEGGEFRWIGTPDQPADFPAVKLVLTSGAVGTEDIPGGDHAPSAATTSEDEALDPQATATDPSAQPAVPQAPTPTEAQDVAARLSGLWAAAGVVVLLVGLWAVARRRGDG